MPIKNGIGYQLKGERNNRPRRPLVFEDKVFVIFVYDKKGFVESRIQCLSTADLSLLWEYKHPHVINNMIITERGGLIASCMNGEVLHFSIPDGLVTWAFTTPTGNIGTLSNEADSCIVFSGIQGNQRTWCITTNSGEERWTIANQGHSYEPFIHNHMVLNTIGHDLNCLDLASGRTLWKASEPRTYLFNPKVVKDVVLAPGHGLVNGYDLASGQLVRTLQTGAPIQTSAAGIREVIADENAMYFGDMTGQFYCYSLPSFQNRYTAKLLWKAATKQGIESIPAFYEDSVFVINNGKQFLSLHKDSGALVQELKTKGEAYISGVTVVGDTAFYSCYGGHVVKCALK